MRLYLEVAIRSFRRHLAYRAAALAGLFTNSVFGVLIASVYLAFYRDAGVEDEVAGFALAEALTYVWLVQALIAVIAIWGVWEIALTIRTGDVVSDLMKPFDYLLYWLSQDLGRAASQMLLRFVPTLALGALLFDLALPQRAWDWLAFGASLGLAVVVSFGIRFLFNLATFWLTDVQGVRGVALVLTTFFSGHLLPLTFFPDWLRPLAEALPFRAIVMTPIEVLLGQTTVWAALGLQIAWALALTGAGYAVLGRATRKMVVQGG